MYCQRRDTKIRFSFSTYAFVLPVKCIL